LEYIKDGFHADAGRTFIVGEGSPLAKKLIQVTEQAFFAGVDQAVAGNRIGDISNAIQTVVEGAGFNLLREYQGHGIGREMHEDPFLFNYRTNSNVIIKKNCAIAIEPMLNLGTDDIVVEDNEWTITTLDKKPSAHFEHTVLVTKDGCQILTGE
jgi:methionyl aminopeptidase